MFTGIIEKKGKFVRIKKNGKTGSLTILPESPFENLIIGESIAVNGCCLSLETVKPDGELTFHAMEETFRKTNLGTLKKNETVNLERALKLGDRLGGHWVSGHVDMNLQVISLAKSGDDIELKIASNEELLPFLAPKGSIAVNGVSLTLVEVNKKFFTVHLIPLTLNDSNLGTFKGGEFVNIESDIIGKYLYFQSHLSKSKITMEMLKNAGF